MLRGKLRAQPMRFEHMLLIFHTAHTHCKLMPIEQWFEMCVGIKCESLNFDV